MKLNHTLNQFHKHQNQAALRHQEQPSYILKLLHSKNGQSTPLYAPRKTEKVSAPVHNFQIPLAEHKFQKFLQNKIEEVH